ncbi:hypothetical protein C8A00DRAFT_33074 [Chaetomidium leptoderma]|uniref:BZIP domain-containing protein n=1 Tax=Chaetomidium leptoderma TaxID=669021 RepID=A0AAN6VN21_9PEZI|nr:hypothetical protein C8A00DRAFT_33074 [Chaetomidium leptoderma]
MSPQPAHKEPPRSSKGKGKGARRVSNLSEEQRNKKRENDRIAQQNIRRRNRELIEKLQHEVEVLRKLDRIEMVKRLMRRNRELEDEVHMLKKTLFLHTGRPYPASSFEMDGLPPGGGHASEYNLPQTFGSPYLASANPYDQWPSSVVPVPSTVTVDSVESSPGASGPSEDFTPAYVHTSVPMMDGGAVMASSTSAPSLDSAKVDYQELDADPPATNGFPNHDVQQQSSSTYMQEPPWPVYPGGTYYSQATAL